MKKAQESGMTLVEVLASVTILSILAVGMLAVFPKALAFTKANQSKTIAVNLARGALHYIEKQDYDLLTGYRDAEGLAVLEGKESCTAVQTVLLDGKSTNSRLFPDSGSCEKLLEPTINNRMYSKNNIQLFLMPEGWDQAAAQRVLQHIAAAHPETKTEQLKKQLSELSHKHPEPSRPIVDVLVYVDLDIQDAREGILLEGSIAHESIR